MTPKEKAKELIRKYWFEINDIAENSISWRQGKKSALICVDEIIDSIEIGFEDYKALAKNSYWNEVKEEIEKL
jgi:hypothetical protein